MNPTLAYHAYLLSVEWARLRMLALEASGYRCEFCGAGGVLHVHHLHYRTLFRETLDDLAVLCVSCHRDAHDFPKFRRDVERLIAARRRERPRLCPRPREAA